MHSCKDSHLFWSRFKLKFLVLNSEKCVKIKKGIYQNSVSLIQSIRSQISVVFSLQFHFEVEVSQFCFRCTPEQINRKLRFIINFKAKSKVMFKQNDQFVVKNGQFYFQIEDDQEKLEFQNQETYLGSSVETMIHEQSSTLNAIGDAHMTNNQGCLDSESQESDKDSSLKTKKKRNTQNTIRSILRLLRDYITGKWNISIPGFFESQKQLYLLAVFRKENMQNRLQQLKSFLKQKCQSYLHNDYQKRSKELKLQLHIKFFLGLTAKDLDDLNIQKTLVQLSNAAKFKNHPTKLNVQELYQIEVKFQ